MLKQVQHDMDGLHKAFKVSGFKVLIELIYNAD
jgi:hypothetical protein